MRIHTKQLQQCEIINNRMVCDVRPPHALAIRLNEMKSHACRIHISNGKQINGWHVCQQTNGIGIGMKYVHIIFWGIVHADKCTRARSLTRTHARMLSFLDAIHCPMFWHVRNSKDIWPSSIELRSSYYYYIINSALPTFCSPPLERFTKTLPYCHNANDSWKLSKETKYSKKLIPNAMRNFSPIYIRQS